MWPNYFRYEKQKLLNLTEVLDLLDVNEEYFNDGFANTDDLFDFIKNSCEIDLDNANRTPYSFIEIEEPEETEETEETEENARVITELALSLMNKLFDRYEDEIFLAFDEECKLTDEERQEKLLTACRKRVKKLLNVLDYTYPKYSALLSAYETAKNELMAGVGWSESESIENSQGSESSGSSSNQNLLKINDTPQIKETTPTLYDTDAFVSEYHKDNGSESHSEEASLSGTIERSKSIANDKETKIERLAELEKKYSQVWRNWLNEFDKLFTSEENY